MSGGFGAAHQNGAVRILHVSRNYHPYVGGTENVMASLVGALSQRGVTSRVVVTDRRRGAPGPAPAVDVLAVPAVGPDRFPLPVGRLGAVARAVRWADVVHLHDLRFLFETIRLTSWATRTPMVLSTHGLIFHTERLAGAKSLLWHHYYGRVLPTLDRIIADSRRDAALCREAGATANVEVVLNGVDTHDLLALDPTAARTPHRLLYFGRIAPEKSLERLPPVIEALPTPWRLRLAGGGSPEDQRWLQERLSSVADRVDVLGHVSEEQRRSELAQCTAVVLPSREEAFGLTLVEAMAAGAPVVASDIPAYRELGEDTGVRLVDFDDPRGVATAIEEAGARDHDPEPGRRRAAQLSVGAMTDRILSIYREVCR